MWELRTVEGGWGYGWLDTIELDGLDVLLSGKEFIELEDLDIGSLGKEFAWVADEVLVGTIGVVVVLGRFAGDRTNNLELDWEGSIEGLDFESLIWNENMILWKVRWREM